MALNLDAIGKKIGPFEKEYTWKDAVLYALGVGAGFSDLDYCYEKNLKVIPSFGITTIYDLMPQLEFGRDPTRRAGDHLSLYDSTGR